VLDRILAGHKTTITAMSWSPTNPRLVATAAAGKRLTVWNVVTEQEAAYAGTGDEMPTCVEWAPTCADGVLAYGTERGTVALWRLARGAGECVPLRECCHTAQATVVRWHPKLGGRIAVGFVDGTVITADLSSMSSSPAQQSSSSSSQHQQGRRVFKGPAAGQQQGTVKRPEVVDATWDPLSSSYLLVGHRSGHIILYDCDSNTTLNSFDVLSGGECPKSAKSPTSTILPLFLVLPFFFAWDGPFFEKRRTRTHGREFSSFAWTHSQRTTRSLAGRV
jgi:WD40 repeat protein